MTISRRINPHKSVRVSSFSDSTGGLKKQGENDRKGIDDTHNS